MVVRELTPPDAPSDGSRLQQPPVMRLDAELTDGRARGIDGPSLSHTEQNRNVRSIMTYIDVLAAVLIRQ